MSDVTRNGGRVPKWDSEAFLPMSVVKCDAFAELPPLPIKKMRRPAVLAPSSTSNKPRIFPSGMESSARCWAAM